MPDVSDEYLDKKLASYGAVDSVNIDNQSSSKSDVQQVGSRITSNYFSKK